MNLTQALTYLRKMAVNGGALTRSTAEIYCKIASIKLNLTD